MHRLRLGRNSTPLTVRVIGSLFLSFFLSFFLKLIGPDGRPAHHRSGRWMTGTHWSRHRLSLQKRFSLRPRPRRLLRCKAPERDGRGIIPTVTSTQ
uniref:Secreted protein n=1 Tax=Denticeps clupeoides TaxID=299321 RepID=A0AAY4B2S5_9TELE